MFFDLSYRDKVEAIDFIINALMEHKKVLEEQTKRLSELLKRFSQGDDAGIDSSSTKKEETSQEIAENSSAQSNKDSRMMWKERGWRLRFP